MEITRKRFVMENPQRVDFGSGEWAFWLTCADGDMYDFVASMPQVANLHYEDVWRRARVSLSPLYDYQEAWLWIYEQLENETRGVELGANWGLDVSE